MIYFFKKNRKGRITPTFDVKGIGLLTYHFDRRLNKFVNNVGASFKEVSQSLRKFLHTGNWRQYALIIFFAIISLVVLGLIVL